MMVRTKGGVRARALMGTSALVVGTVLSGVSPAWAQSSLILEEIMVTAQKREQNLQSVGISVTAFSGDAMRALGFTSSNEIAAQIPGVAISDIAGAPNNILISIRGASQNDFADHNESPNAVYVDEAYVSVLGGVGFQLFDLERVEVLRGPQGTLFGRNATGGLVHYITKKPSEKTDGYVEVGYADYNQIRVEGAAGGGTEKISGRLSATYLDQDGYFKNHIGPDFLAAKRWAVRGQVLVNPADSFEIWLKGSYGRTKDKPGSTYKHGAAIADPDNHNLGRYLTPGENPYDTCDQCDPFGYRDMDPSPWGGSIGRLNSVLDRETYGATGRLTWNSEAVTLTSLTDYLKVDKIYDEDCDGSPNGLCGFGTVQATKQFSQELRANGEFDRARWVAGFYYLKIKGDYDSHLIVDYFDGTPDEYASVNTYRLDTKSWAVFGQAEYDLTDQFTLTVGARWTDDSKKFSFVNMTKSFDPDLDAVVWTPLLTFTDDLIEDMDGVKTGLIPTKHGKGDYSLKINLDYRPNDTWLFYAGVSRGIKGGGFSAPLDGLLFADQLAYGQETIWNYEIGFKANLFDGRARFNAGAFYSDYGDYQAFDLRGLTQVIVNRDANLKGLEAELAASVGAGIDINLGVSLLDAKVKGIGLPDGSTATRKMTQAPKFTLNALLRKTWDLGEHGSFAAQFDMNHASSQFYTVANHPTTYQGPHTVGNVRLIYTTADDRWQATFYVKNLWEEKYATYAFDLADAFGIGIRSFGPPRWFGGTISYRFGG